MNYRDKIITGDCLDVLRGMPDGLVHCVVTSPPYWGLRDYQVEGQLGLEKTPEEYVTKMVKIFQEVRRVLRDDGTVWLNLGDSYATTPPGCVHGDYHIPCIVLDPFMGAGTTAQGSCCVSSGASWRDC